MKRDFIWERIKNDTTEIYGEPMLDMFLKSTEFIERRHWEELPTSKRKMVSAQCELEIARTPEEAVEAMKRGEVYVDSALVASIKRGDLKMIEFLADKGVTHKNYVLDVASEYGNLESVKALIKAGSEPGESSLERAAFGGHIEIVRHLIKSKPGMRLKTALYNAAAAGHMEVIEYVISQESTGLNDANFAYALEKATENGQLKVMQFLIDKGTSELEPALLRSIWSGQREAMDMLLDNGADPTGAIIWASDKKYHWALESMMKRHKCLKIAKRLSRDYPDVAEFLQSRERFA